jgi:hypothetical protein
VNGAPHPVRSPTVNSCTELVMRSPQPHCEVALMLCESLIHLLVEEGVLTKAKAIEAIETVAELTHEIAESAPSVTSQIAVDLEDLAASFTLQESARSNANLESVASARSPLRQL